MSKNIVKYLALRSMSFSTTLLTRKAISKCWVVQNKNKQPPHPHIKTAQKPPNQTTQTKINPNKQHNYKCCYKKGVASQIIAGNPDLHH